MWEYEFYFNKDGSEKSLQEQIAMVSSCGHEADFSELEKRAKQGVGRYGARGANVTARLDEELSVIKEMGIAEIFLLAQSIVKKVKEICYPLVSGEWSCSLVAYALGIVDGNPLDTNTTYHRLFHRKKEQISGLTITIPRVWEQRVKCVIGKDSFFVDFVFERNLPLVSTEVEKILKDDSFDDYAILNSAAFRYYKVYGDSYSKRPMRIKSLADFADYYIRFKWKPDNAYYEQWFELFVKEYGFSEEDAEVALKTITTIRKPELEAVREKFIVLANEKGLTKERANAIFDEIKGRSQHCLLKSAVFQNIKYLYLYEKLILKKHQTQNEAVTLDVYDVLPKILDLVLHKETVTESELLEIFDNNRIMLFEAVEELKRLRFIETIDNKQYRVLVQCK